MGSPDTHSGFGSVTPTGVTKPNSPRGLAPFPAEGGVASEGCDPGSWSPPPHPPLPVLPLFHPSRAATSDGARPRDLLHAPPLARVGERRHLESCLRRHLLRWRPPASQQRRLPWRRPPGFASSAVSSGWPVVSLSLPAAPPPVAAAARLRLVGGIVRVACRKPVARPGVTVSTLRQGSLARLARIGW